MIFFLVSGLPHAGKSTWINNNFDVNNPGIKIIDIYHIQCEHCKETRTDGLYSYLLQECELTFKTLAGHDAIIIVEGALLTKTDRKFLSDRFNKYRKDGDKMFLVWCDAPKGTIVDRIRYDGMSDGDEWIQSAFDRCETPTDAEGFDDLITSMSEGADKNVRLFLARFHCGYTGSDPVEADEIVSAFENGAGEYRFGDTYRKKLMKKK